MELISPFTKKDRQPFLESAIEIGFDEFVARKFIYTILDSDLDVFQLMYDERLSLLIYGWEIADIYMQDDKNSDSKDNYTPKKPLLIVLKWLAHYSLDIWLSTEWDNGDLRMRMGLLYCLRRVKKVLTKVPEVSLLNWEHMLTAWDLRPWQKRYINQFLKSNQQLQHSMEQSIEEIEYPATRDDIDFLREEDILIILLRLVKMLDGFFTEGAKQLAMRVIAGWNAVYERAKEIPNNENPQLPDEYKKCILSICHIYLLAVYELDDNRGFVIDNMMNNIRFYYQTFQEKKFRKPLEDIAQLHFTSARYIALTCINLDVCIDYFFEMFACNSEEKNFSTLYGVISQSYISYILGNQLMHMNTANTDSFNSNLESYKRILDLYIKEREASEIFCKDQLHRQLLQHNSHTQSRTMKNLTDFASKFCKGNRPTNIENCESTDEDKQEDQSLEAHSENAKKIDPVFENIPNNEKILKDVYKMLANRTFNGWDFAKTILLVKIIGHEVNQIETWRYHPGLTVDFMLNLDVQLSRHYEDLALIFTDYYFLEQEFWLTAFYLNPIKKYFESVTRCGSRLLRKQNQADEIIEISPKNERSDRGNNEKHIKNAKYGLLSSTIDVKEIVNITDHDKVNVDYSALTEALEDLKLSERTIKDLLTVIFLPRNKYYAWAVNWQELRKRCKTLHKCPEFKRNLVGLSMAEANDRLKFLKIDYEKYKHRPQLDYGTIEQGYENILNAADEDDSDEDDDDDDEDEDVNNENEKDTKQKDIEKKKGTYDENDDDNENKTEEDIKNSDSDEDNNRKGKRKRGRKKRNQDISLMSKKEMELIDNICSTGTRRTRARIAAALESEKIKQTEKNKEKEEVKEKEKEDGKATEKMKEGAEVDESQAISERNPAEESNAVNTSESTASIDEKRSLNKLLEQRPVYSNKTTGFQAYTDIWDFDSTVSKSVDVSYTMLSETEKFLEQFSIWKSSREGEGNNSCAALESEHVEGNLSKSDVTEYDTKKANDATVEDVTQTLKNNENITEKLISKNRERSESEIIAENTIAANIDMKQDNMVSDPTDEEITSTTMDEPMTLVADETITVEEVFIEDKDNVHFVISEQKESEIKISPETNIEEKHDKSEPSSSKQVKNQYKESVADKDSPISNVDEQLKEVVEKVCQLEYNDGYKDEDQLKTNDRLKDGNLNIDDNELKYEDNLKSNIQDNVEFNDGTDLDHLKDTGKNKGNVEDVEDTVQSKHVEKRKARVKNDTQLKVKDIDKQKDADQHKDIEQNKDNDQFKDGREIHAEEKNQTQVKIEDGANDASFQAKQIVKECKKQDRTDDDQLKEVDDDTHLEIKKIEQNSKECTENEATEKPQCSNVKLKGEEISSKNIDHNKEGNLIDKSKHDHPYEAESNIKIKSESSELSSSECENQSLASIKRSVMKKPVLASNQHNKEIDQIIKDDEKSSLKDDKKNSLETNETSNDMENRVSEQTLTVFEELQKRLTPLPHEDDDASTFCDENVADLNEVDSCAEILSEELIEKFSLKNAVICLKRLTVNDLSHLRQPCVKIRRMDVEKPVPLKRSIRNVEHRSYIGLDESSKSSNCSCSIPAVSRKFKSYVKHERKRKFSHSSTSSSDEILVRPVKSARQQTARKKAHNVPLIKLRKPIKKLMVTPRSASGLKMRISSAPASRKSDDNIELIHISSSSSSPQVIDDDSDVEVEDEEEIEPTTFINISEEIMRQNDPLYEEELVLLD